MVDQAFIKQKVAAFLKISAADLNDEMALSDLIADSFVVIELMIDLQETCEIRLTHEDVSHVRTVGELATLIETIAHRTSAIGQPMDELAVAARED